MGCGVAAEMTCALLQDIQKTDVVRIWPVREKPGRTAVFRFQLKQKFGVGLNRPDLRAVAHDATVL